MSIATCIQSAMQEAGVVIAPAYIAGFSSIPRAAITPSTPVMLLGHKYLKLQKYYFSGFCCMFYKVPIHVKLYIWE